MVARVFSPRVGLPTNAGLLSEALLFQLCLNIGGYCAEVRDLCRGCPSKRVSVGCTSNRTPLGLLTT